MGIKFQHEKINAFIPDLGDEPDFVRKHKLLCRLATDRFKEIINTNQQQNDNIVGEDNIHDLVTILDVGLELYPVVPGKNFVLNAPEAKLIFTSHLNQSLIDEKVFERSSYILQPENEHNGNDPLDSDNEDNDVNWYNLGEYNQSHDYVYNADLFHDEQYERIFNHNGTNVEATIMDQQGNIMANQYEFPHCNQSRVIKLTRHTRQTYIPLPVSLDKYMQTLDDDAQNLPNQPGSDNDDWQSNLITVEQHSGNDNAVTDDESDDDSSISERMENMNDQEEDMLEQEENPSSNSTDNPSVANTGSVDAVQFGDNENYEISLERLVELREINKNLRSFPQYLSNGRIGNVHHEKIVIELVNSNEHDDESELTVKLSSEEQSKTCHGANIYMPCTRSMFTKQSSKVQQLQSLLTPHLLKDILSNVISTPSKKDYDLLREIIIDLNSCVDELLGILKCTDKQPIHQEITFATNNLWKHKFRWPTSQLRRNNCHIGVADS